MTSYDHLHKLGNSHHLIQRFGNPETTLVEAERWIIAHPDADRSRARRPDLLIAFGVDPEAYEASNGYVISEQGKPPDFVMEIASESTARTDVVEKRVEYAGLGIPEYWRFDETGEHHGARLGGDRLVNGRYEPMPIHDLPDGSLAVSRGDEAFAVEVKLTFMFRNERTAESEMDNLEDYLEDDLPRAVDIEDVASHGVFVVVTASVDEDDYDPEQLP